MTEHASLGGSGAHRWMHCPGSVKLSENIPDTTSEYAAEGTAAHALAEECLTAGADAHANLDMQVVRHPDYRVTKDMADAVQVYLDFVREQLAGGAELDVECQFDLSPLKPPAPMFGTADAVVWDPQDRGLHVIDFKYGQGVVVEAVDNEQLLYYALGVVLTKKIRPARITLSTVQPRAFHPDGPIRTWEITWEELVEFKTRMMEAATLAVLPDPPVGPVGDHCRWCRAKAICPAQRGLALTIAQEEFATAETDAVPAPETLEDTQLVELLEKATYIEQYIAAAREYAKAKLQAGGSLPGWKLVRGRSSRSWADESAMEAWLKQRFGAKKAYVKKLISPAQAEKLLKSKPRLTLPAGAVNVSAGGVKLVPESNAKAAISAADEFSTSLLEE